MAISFALLILVATLVGLAAVIAGIIASTKALQRKARKAGYSSLGEYLSAAPRTEQEKREAVDLALKGIVLCLLGLVFPPFLLIGAFPFYYGARKVAYSSMGFGLFEDSDPPSS